MADYSSYYNEKYATMAGSWDGTTSGILFTDRRDFYIDPYEVASLYASVAPFTAFSSQLPVVQAPDPDFKMFEEDDNFVNQKFVVNDVDGATWSAGAATIAAADGAVAINLGSNLIGLECEIRAVTTGVLRAVAVITNYSSGQITFKSLGNPEGSVTNITDNDVVYVVGNAQAEGQRSPYGWTSQPRVVWNSCQIQKTPFRITGSLLQASLRGFSNELARFRFNKGQEHAIQNERKNLFGYRVDGNAAPTTSMLLDSTDSRYPIRTTLGVIPALHKYGITSGDDQNVFSIAAGEYDYDMFVDDSTKWFQYNPGGRLTLMAGATLINFFHKMGDGNGFLGNSGASVQISQSVRGGIGYSFREVFTPSGVVELVYNPILRGPYANYGIMVAPGTIKRVQYRTDEYQAAIQENDADYVKDQYFSDDGIMITNLKKNHLLKLA